MSRMRTRVQEFLKVLNRAKPEIADEKKDKKLASGRTFQRK
jgi:actin related protein 2/3 complex subunit 2